MTRSIDELPATHQATIRAFAVKNGRSWKAKLGNAWGMGTDTHFPDGHNLRDIRNNPAWGHAWLAAVKI